MGRPRGRQELLLVLRHRVDDGAAGSARDDRRHGRDHGVVERCHVVESDGLLVDLPIAVEHELREEIRRKRLVGIDDDPVAPRAAEDRRNPR